MGRLLSGRELAATEISGTADSCIVCVGGERIKKEIVNPWKFSNKCLTKHLFHDRMDPN
jgi:hypothetical protein